MNKTTIQTGTVVISCAGKDAGRMYVVIARLAGSYVWIADGRTYRVEKPKKKNCRHLRIFGTSVTAQDDSSTRISNEWIRSVLNRAKVESTREVRHV